MVCPKIADESFQAHGHGAGSAWAIGWTAFLILAACAYVYGGLWQRRRGRVWSLWRSLAFLSGLVLVAAAMLGPISERGHGDLTWHMAQHLLVGMLAPLGLVLGAPVTLALRTLPKAWARSLVRLLASRFVQLLSHPFSASVINIGGMYLLYLTPLYAAMAGSTLLHQLVHVHFLLAGCLFTWAIAGPDPGPQRESVDMRLFALFFSIATHATLGKLMYAYGFPRGTMHGDEEIRVAAQWMYYGGDAAELLLAAALFASWSRFPPGRLIQFANSF